MPLVVFVSQCITHSVFLAIPVLFPSQPDEKKKELYGGNETRQTGRTVHFIRTLY